MSLMDRPPRRRSNHPTPPPLPPGLQPRRRSRVGGLDAERGWRSGRRRRLDSGVTVLREEVVGPYAVAIVRGTDGMGLRDWLRMNGYVVPRRWSP
jgi:hypothetical protein